MVAYGGDVMKERCKEKGLRWYTPFATGLDLAARLFVPKRPHILVACLPKTGSTFLTNVLAEHSGLRRTRLTPVGGHREQEFSELRLSRYNHVGYVCQHHIKYSAWTQEMIRRYHMTPVVLVRDLFDIVASMRDHLRAEGPIWSMATFNERHVALPDDELDAAIVELAVPWFINFYTGWRHAPDTLMLEYEDVMQDPPAAIKSVLDRAGIANTQDSIRKAIEKGYGQFNRINKGVSGRGMAIRPQTRQRVIDKLSFYPEIMDDPYIKKMLQRNSGG